MPTSADTFPVQTPVFLYTPVPLVRGVDADPLVGAAVGVFPARAAGYRLYRAAMFATNSDLMGFVAAQTGYATVGRLFVIHPHRYAGVLDALDRAFGFRDDRSSVYMRRRAAVDWVIDGAAVVVHAWLYEGGATLLGSTHLCSPVPRGDFSAWLAASHAHRSVPPAPDRAQP
ncbi:MAG TPA: hypothetical protein VFX70_14855 [Mycobacteriales bacterium]|nr:hypothetical protein [Mycobacteriales bacterium]